MPRTIMSYFLCYFTLLSDGGKTYIQKSLFYFIIHFDILNRFLKRLDVKQL